MSVSVQEEAMLSQDYEYIHSYHQDLIRQAGQARLASWMCADSPSIKDHICLRAGNLLITLGLKIKAMSAFREKRVYNELSRECS
jgi:hypothetical protein